MRARRSLGALGVAVAWFLALAAGPAEATVSGPNPCAGQPTYPWMGDSISADVTIPSQGQPNGITSYVGTILRPADASTYPGPRPLVVLQHGLGGNRCGLWWAAQDLAGHGYVALVWTAPTAGSTATAFTNAVDATRSAIAFSRTPSNPFAALTDTNSIAIGGHSLGAIVTSYLQGEPDPGVRAAVAFDSLRRWASGDPAAAVFECNGEQILEVAPRVPALGFAMDQPCIGRQDFVPPDLKHSGFLHWRTHGVPSMSLVMAGYDHGDFSGGGSESQWRDLAYFTEAWLDRWLQDDDAATDRLLSREVLGRPTASLLSTQFLSGAYLAPLIDTTDYLGLLNDVTAPRTKRLRGPDGPISRKLVRRRGLRFAFKGSEDEADFECRLDGREYRGCDSPKRFERVALGGHVFRVRATDAAGNQGKPAVWRFRLTR